MTMMIIPWGFRLHVARHDY